MEKKNKGKVVCLFLHTSIHQPLFQPADKPLKNACHRTSRDFCGFWFWAPPSTTSVCVYVCLSLCRGALRSILMSLLPNKDKHTSFCLFATWGQIEQAAKGVANGRERGWYCPGSVRHKVN